MIINKNYIINYNYKVTRNNIQNNIFRTYENLITKFNILNI